VNFAHHGAGGLAPGPEDQDGDGEPARGQGRELRHHIAARGQGVIERHGGGEQQAHDERADQDARLRELDPEVAAEFGIAVHGAAPAAAPGLADAVFPSAAGFASWAMAK